MVAMKKTERENRGLPNEGRRDVVQDTPHPLISSESLGGILTLSHLTPTSNILPVLQRRVFILGAVSS